MLPLRFARQWQMLSAALLLLVLIAAVLPAAWFLPDSVRLVPWLANLDKWAHVLGFAAITVWFTGQYPRQAYWRIALGLGAYGVLIELCQQPVSYRSAEWPDVAADVTGIAIGLLIAMAGAGGWCQPFEDWYVGRKARAGVD